MNKVEEKTEEKVVAEKRQILISEGDNGIWELKSDKISADTLTKLLVNFAIDTITQQAVDTSLKVVMQTLRAEFGSKGGPGIISPHTGGPIVK